MARGINPSRLANVIKQLQGERQELQRRIDEIDNIFAQCGISVTASAARRGPGRPAAAAAAAPSAPARGKRRRRRFGTSATQSLVDFIKKAGRGGAGSSDISKHWKSEGRAGEPYVSLGHLVKTGKLKKKNVEGQRGSQYFLA